MPHPFLKQNRAILSSNRSFFGLEKRNIDSRYSNRPLRIQISCCWPMGLRISQSWKLVRIPLAQKIVFYGLNKQVCSARNLSAWRPENISRWTNRTRLLPSCSMLKKWSPSNNPGISSRSNHRSSQLGCALRILGWKVLPLAPGGSMYTLSRLPSFGWPLILWMKGFHSG